MSFTDKEILMLFGLLAVAIAGIIFFMKKRFDNQVDDLASKYHSDVLSPSLKKYPEADLYKMNNIFFRVGLICAVAISILAFNWTTFEDKISEDLLLNCGFDYDIEQATPRTLPAQNIPPPPPPIIDEVEIDEDIEDDFEFSDQEFENDFDNIPHEADEEINDDRPIELEEEEDLYSHDDWLINIVEDMPSFPGCGDFPTNEERRKCTERKLLKYVYENLKYPIVARENSIEGLVIARFVVNEDGKIQDIEIIKDIGGGCGEELERIIETMNDFPESWKAAEQRGRKVPVRYNLPIRFKWCEN